MGDQAEMSGPVAPEMDAGPPSRDEIARLAYEISQRDDAGSDLENPGRTRTC
jgi:hypothetical protein